MKNSLIKLFSLTLLLLTSCGKPQINIVLMPEDDSNNFPATSYKKVVILAGQSNACGVCHESELKKNVSNEKFEQYKNGFSNVLISYNCDVNLSYEFVSTKLGQGSVNTVFGPEVGFAEYCAKYTTDNIYIIKYAKGGTQLDSQWLDGNYNRGKLYNELKDFVLTQINKLGNAKIIGTMWMQGESDCNQNINGRYYQNQKNLMSFLREDFKDYIQPSGMIFADAGIADNWPDYYVINNAKVELSKLSNLNVYFSTTENGLRNDQEPAGNIDRAHYDSLSGLQLGKFFAQVIKQKMNEIINNK